MNVSVAEAQVGAVFTPGHLVAVAQVGPWLSNSLANPASPVRFATGHRVSLTDEGCMQGPDIPLGQVDDLNNYKTGKGETATHEYIVRMLLEEYYEKSYAKKKWVSQHHLGCTRQRQFTRWEVCAISQYTVRIAYRASAWPSTTCITPLRANALACARIP